MNKNRAIATLGLFLALAMVGGGRALAANTNPAYLDLIVAFNGALSLKIDGVQYSTRTLGSLAPGVTSTPGSSATVTNDGSVTEKWQLSAADVSTATAQLWTVVNTTGNTGGGNYCATLPGAGTGCPQNDQYALQALFISSAASAACMTNTATDWDAYVSTVSGTPTTYQQAMYADATYSLNGATGTPDQTAGAQNGNMYVAAGSSGVGKRGLCVRLTMPASSNTGGAYTHIIRTTISAVAGG
jgi:hypothetical protein